MVGVNSTWNYGWSAANTLAETKKGLGQIKVKCNAHKPYRKKNRKS